MAFLPSPLSAILIAASLASLAPAASAGAAGPAAGARPLAELGASEGPVRFAAVGGAGAKAGGLNKVGERLRSWDPEFVIAPAEGHPSGGAEILAPAGESPYEAVRGPVHLFFLPPDSVLDAAAQVRWLRKALAASPAAWKIVYLPEAPHSSCAAGPARPAHKAARWAFREWGADAVLSGRGGAYERLRVDGTTFFVNGPDLGAAPSEASRLPGSQSLFAEDAGALLAEADSERIDFRFVTAEGMVVDAHTLRKGALAANPSGSSGRAVPAAVRR